MVFRHESQIASRATSARRPGIPARGIRLPFRVSGAGLISLTRDEAVLVYVLLPAPFKVRIDAFEVLWAVVNITICDCCRGQCNYTRVRPITNLNIHGRISEGVPDNGILCIVLSKVVALATFRLRDVPPPGSTAKCLR